MKLGEAASSDLSTWRQTRTKRLFLSARLTCKHVTERLEKLYCSGDKETWSIKCRDHTWRRSSVRVFVPKETWVLSLNKSLKETHHLFLLSVRRCDSVPQTEHTHKQTHYAVSFTAKQCGKASEIRGPSFEGSSKNKTDVYGIFLRGGGQIQFNCRSKTTVSLS